MSFNVHTFALGDKKNTTFRELYQISNETTVLVAWYEFVLELDGEPGVARVAVIRYPMLPVYVSSLG